MDRDARIGTTKPGEEASLITVEAPVYILTDLVDVVLMVTRGEGGGKWSTYTGFPPSNPSVTRQLPET